MKHIMNWMVMAVVGFGTLTGSAADYFWNNGEGGGWSTLANWKLGSSGAGGDPTVLPGAADTVYFCMGTYTITLSENVRVYKVYLNNSDRSKVCFVTVDLKGFKLETIDSCVANADNSHPDAGLTFLNGQLYSEKYIQVASAQSTAWKGTLTLDHITGAVTNSLATRGAYPHLIITNGTKMTIGGNLGARVERRTRSLDITGPDTVLNLTGAIDLVGPHDVAMRGGVWINQYSGGFALNGYIQDYEIPAGQVGPRAYLDNVTITNTGIKTTLSIGTNNMGGELMLTNHTVLTGYGYCNVGGRQNEYSLSNRLSIVDESLLDLNGFEYGTSRTCDGLNFASAAGTADNTLYVNNGTLRCRFIKFGNDSVTGTGRCATNNWIHIAGTHPLVNSIAHHNGGYSLWLAGGSSIRFDIGLDGYANVPVRVQGTLKITHPTVAPYDTIKSRVHVAARAFDRAHPEERLALIQTNNDSTTALQELIDNATFDSSSHGVLSIEDSGKKLVYTAPKKRGMVLLFR